MTIDWSVMKRRGPTLHSVFCNTNALIWPSPHEIDCTDLFWRKRWRKKRKLFNVEYQKTFLVMSTPFQELIRITLKAADEFGDHALNFLFYTSTYSGIFRGAVILKQQIQRWIVLMRTVVDLFSKQCWYKEWLVFKFEIIFSTIFHACILRWSIEN